MPSVFQYPLVNKLDASHQQDSLQFLAKLISMTSKNNYLVNRDGIFCIDGSHKYKYDAAYVGQSLCSAYVSSAA